MLCVQYSDITVLFENLNLLGHAVFQCERNFNFEVNLKLICDVDRLLILVISGAKDILAHSLLSV